MLGWYVEALVVVVRVRVARKNCGLRDEKASVGGLKMMKTLVHSSGVTEHIPLVYLL